MIYLYSVARFFINLSDYIVKLLEGYNKQMIVFLVKLAFHLLPFIPLLQKNYNVSLILLLIVFLPYIKVHKIERIYIDAQEKEGVDLSSIEKALRRWRSFTFYRQ